VRLERRVFGYLIIVMAALSMMLVIGTAVAIMTNAVQSDRADTLAAVGVVREALATSRSELAADAAELAGRDLTRSIASNGHAGATAAPVGIQNLGIDLYAVYDKKGGLYYRATLTSAGVGVRSQDVVNLLRTWPQLNVSSELMRSVSGLIRLPDGGLMLVASVPVTTADTLESSASLLVGRLLDRTRVSALSRSSQHAVSIQSLAPGTIDDSAADAVFVRSARFSSQTGVAYLADINGSVVGELSVVGDRTAWLGGVVALTVLTFGLVLSALTTVYVLRHGLREMLLGRVETLNAQVDRIRRSGEPERVLVEGDDELSSLGENVNGVVRALEESRDQIQKTYEELEVRVAERTAELSNAVSELEEQIACRRAAEDEREASDARYRLLIDNLSDTVFTLDSDGLITYVSPGVEWAFGYLPADLIGKPVAVLLTLPSAKAIERQLSRGLAKDGNVLGLEAVTADGKELDVEMVLSPLDSSVGATQGIIRDVTARRRYEDELLHMASHDFLTGLANRRRFEEELQRALSAAQRHGTEGAVLWIDLDNFKDVNDTLGHHAGDELLMDIARALRGSVRSESVLARLGGDEFAVLLPIATRDEAREAGERLLAEIAKVHVFFEGRILRARGSMGIVLFPGDGLDVDELLARADIAMYRAKRLGRARSVFFTRDEDWRDEIADRTAWAEQIELAVRENAFIPYAQPIVTLEDGMAGSFELLVRMQDVNGDCIPPARFIDVAERTGLIVDIDLWMLNEAVRLLGEFEDQYLCLNVNVSPRTLADQRFLAEVTRLTEGTGINAERLGIEVIESAIVMDVGTAQDVLRELKRIGCRVLLDGFGSGFTSFLHLKQLPVDTLKIDGDFIQRLHESPNDQHLVRAMVEMARGLGMGTIAECVETGETLDLLRDFGVETIQGNFVGRPGPARETIQAELAHSEARAILLSGL
jgi:diguanylate cyclase (GGDEF)-like protein/PAS domain S-box-containing protein